MFRRLSILVTSMLIVTIATIVLAGCSSAADTEQSGGKEQASSAAGDVALQITGKVDEKMGWAEDEVRAMDTIEAKSVNNSGEVESYSGVPLNTLLDRAGVQADATTLVFVGDDDYEAEVDLADVRDCADCIVSFRNKGGFSMVMPGFPGNTEVKGVVVIRVN